MKLFNLLFCIVLVPSGLAFGQTPVTDVLVKEEMIKANTNLGAIDTKLQTISQNITEQLELAQKATDNSDAIKEAVEKTREALDNLLERIGNPADVSMDDISGGKFGDVTDAVSNALEDGILKERPEPDPDDKSIFSETGGGIIEEIKDTYQYQKESGGGKETLDRDPTKYVGEAEQIKAVNEYYRVRDAAASRREALLEVLSDVLENMNDNADDFAHVAKQTALVEVIQGQLQVCSNDINNAYNDVAVKGLQIYTLNSIRSKGDAEPMTKEMKDKSDAIDGVIDGILAAPGMPSKPAGGAVGMSGFLPWPTR
ncbi:MAG TPA: hypothetical protein VLE43_13955 [Candidatus Saccharimonadia bacterium]|nr:hypothetical protein [Candidatus Saccharimonadia bacterium]